MNLLYFMQGFQRTGTLVRMVVGITLSVFWFTVVLVVVLAGFSLSFYTLYRAGKEDLDDEEEEVYGWDSAVSSFLSGYALMLGELDMESFDKSGDANAMAFLQVIFQFLVNIVSSDDAKDICCPSSATAQPPAQVI